MSVECCGNCIHHRKSADGTWICDNEYGDCYGLETGYNDFCTDYEEQDG